MTNHETSADIITRLAEMPCEAATCGAPEEPCSSCGSTGAHFSWLRDVCICAASRRRFVFYSNYSNSSFVCGECRDQGWLPRVDISLEEAIASLPVRLREGMLAAWTKNIATLVARAPESIRLAFWQAVGRVE